MDLNRSDAWFTFKKERKIYIIIIGDINYSRSFVKINENRFG